MRGKKGMELSMNFIIVLILSIIVFTAGVVFTYRFLGIVEEREENINTETQKQIQSLLMDGHQTAIPIDTITISKGKSEIFGLGIYNSLRDGTETFRVAVQFKRAYDKLDNEMTGSNAPEDGYINENWIFGEKDSEKNINSNEYILVPIKVNVDGDMAHNTITRGGTYEFNVCVCPCKDSEGCSDAEPAFCINHCEADDSLLYGGHIMKLYVVVP